MLSIPDAWQLHVARELRDERERNFWEQNCVKDCIYMWELMVGSSTCRMELVTSPLARAGATNEPVGIVRKRERSCEIFWLKNRWKKKRNEKQQMKTKKDKETATTSTIYDQQRYLWLRPLLESFESKQSCGVSWTQNKISPKILWQS